jgi:hypothetical protein
MSYWKDRLVSASSLGPTLVPHSFDGCVRLVTGAMAAPYRSILNPKSTR